MKIKVKICSGTTCYILGGANLLVIESLLSDKEKKQVEIKAVTCMDYCNEQNSKPPYATVNDVVLDNADQTKLLSEIKKHMK